MDIQDIDKYCDQFEQLLEKNPKLGIDEFIDSLNLPRDQKLVEELNRVAKAYQKHGSNLESTADISNESKFVGKNIGPYKLLQEIGEGGMGTVYMAEQEKPVNRRVALKVIKPGMGSKEVVARFEAERQALAMMDHESIAKMFDAGATDEGRPYFVMELVRGVPITQFCDDNQLSIRDRLSLFAKVCHAVQHAHQKGIIHRDIKPSNVLVSNYDGRPVPKIIDFGVAKATQQKLTEKTLFTEFGRIVGTLQYMSPEQAGLSQMDIDTRSDIYSLGILLYELLTGETPIQKQQIREAGWEAVMQLIREAVPPKPSTKISQSGSSNPKIADNRSTHFRSLNLMVRGDVDWIVMKALEKDRSRRYETANQFAKDIENHLSNRPIVAGQPSAWYRLKKSIVRNRGVVASVAATLVVLSVLSLILLWKNSQLAAALADTQRAEKETDVFNNFLVNELLWQADPDLNPYQEQTTVVQLLDRAAVKIENNSLFDDQPLIEASIRLVIGKMYHALGSWVEAKTHIQRAYNLRRRYLGEEEPKTLDAFEALTKVQIDLESFESALAGSKKLEQAWSRQPERSDRVMEAQILRTQALSGLGQYQRAEQLARQIISDCDRVDFNRSLLSRARESLADVLAVQFKDFEEIRSLYKANLDALRSEMDSENSDAILATKLKLASNMIYLGKFKEAELFSKEVYDTRSQLSLPPDHPHTIRAQLMLGKAQLYLGKISSAMQMFKEAHQQSLKLLGEDNELTWNARNAIVNAIGGCVVFLAPNFEELSKHAEQSVNEMIETCETRKWPAEHSYKQSTDSAFAQVLVLKGMVKKKTALGSIVEPKELQRAYQLLNESYESRLSRLGPLDQSTLLARKQVIQLQMLRGKKVESIEEFLMELENASDTIPGGININEEMDQSIGQYYANAGNLKDAEPYFRRHFEHWESTEFLNPVEKRSSVSNLFHCLYLLGHSRKLTDFVLEKDKVYKVNVDWPSANPVVIVVAKNQMSKAAGLDYRTKDISFIYLFPSKDSPCTVEATYLVENSPTSDPKLDIQICNQTDKFELDGVLDEDSPTDVVAFNLPCKEFKIAMKAGCVYRFDCERPGFYPYIRIEDPEKRIVEWTRQEQMARRRFSFSPVRDGEYNITIAAPASNVAGKFSLDVLEFTPENEIVPRNSK